MSDFSFGSLLKNPLVLGVLATKMTSNLAQSYTEVQNQQRADEAQQTKELSSIAGQTGKITTEVPRSGLFGKIATQFGASPNVPLKPYQIAEEGAAVQAGQAAQQADVEKLIGLRKELGPEGWANYKSKLMEGTPYQRKLVEMAPDIPELPSEKKAQQEQSTSKTIYLPDGSTREISIPKGGTYNPETVFGKGASLKAPNKPDKSDEAIESGAAARTRGGIRGKLDSSIFASPNPYYDPRTGNPVTKEMSQRDARKAGMIPASPKAIQSYNDAKSVVSELDRLDEIAQRRLPDTASLSDNMKALAIGKSWATLHAKTGILNLDNEANELVNASKLPAIQLIHEIQQRYPSQIELKSITPLLPGAADDKQSFHDKVVKLKSLLSHGIQQGAREDASSIIGKEGEDAAKDWVGGD